ncbi:hypothetical protein CsSME_00033382 [Camellia sinensis var. sinensis]
MNSNTEACHHQPKLTYSPPESVTQTQGDRTIDISLGTGHPASISLPLTNMLQPWLYMLQSMLGEP